MKKLIIGVMVLMAYSSLAQRTEEYSEPAQMMFANKPKAFNHFISMAIENGAHSEDEIIKEVNRLIDAHYWIHLNIDLDNEREFEIFYSAFKKYLIKEQKNPLLSIIDWELVKNDCVKGLDSMAKMELKRELNQY